MNLSRAFEIGMHQHRAEIEPFAHWLSQRKLHHVMEIGTLHGGTAALWHSLCTGQVISVDLPEGRFGGADHHLNVERCMERSARLHDEFPRFVGVLGDLQKDSTRGLVGQILDQQLDFLFIDGDHTYEGVRRDYDIYAPLVADGGVIAFHDINDTKFHHDAGCFVDQLWRELKGEKIEFSIGGDWGGIGVLIV